MSSKIRFDILLILTGMASALGACTSDTDPDTPATESREEMTFEVASRPTRTITTTKDNIYNDPFMLFGDAKLPDADASEVKTFFHWEEVKYDTISKKWEYAQKKQYWFMGQEHSFVAIHPFIAKNDEQVKILTYEDSKLSFTYHLPEKLEEAKDLLFAVHRRKYTLDNTGPIQLEFTHLLPRINISMALEEKEFMYDHVEENVDTVTNTVIGNANEYIKVHSIEFQKIKTKASFTFTAVPLGSNKTSTYDYEKEYMVRDDDKTETIVVTLTEALKVPNSYKKSEESDKQTYVKALKDEEIVVMLPQSFDANSDSKIVINYSINEDKDLSRRIVIPLAGTEWKEGKSYTYKFLIDNVYKGHIIDEGTITVDIDDFRLKGDEEVRDDSWITDKDDPGHNITYGYDENGNCGPTQDKSDNTKK